MSPALNRLLLRLGCWPRRFAVLVCIVLGLTEAIHPRGGVTAGSADPLDRLQAGQVAVPVTLRQPGVDGLLRAGQRVGLFAAPATGGSDVAEAEAALLADHLLLLRVSGVPPGGGADASIVVAADRSTASRIAGASHQTILAVLDKSP